MKGNKGITLIALVITIIVLLILAGVSIAMLTGENSILSRGSQASAENQLGAANDAISLLVANRVAEFYEKAYVNNNATTLQKGLDWYLSSEDSEGRITIAQVQTEIANGNITKVATNGSIIDVNWPSTFDKTNGNDVFVLKLNDNQNTYTSTGKYLNGKVTWTITKGNKETLTTPDRD